jgi:hypothetical protein
MTEGVTFEALDRRGLVADEEFWEIYRYSFPPEEREPKDVIVESLGRGGVAVRAVSNGRTVGLATTQRLTAPDAVFLVYLGLDRAFRGGGLGAALTDATFRLSATPTSLGMVWEVDDPDLPVSAEELAIRQRRVRFFSRLGGRLVDLPYHQPPVDGVHPVPMRLMWRGEGDLPDGIVPAIYFQKYGAVNGIPAKVLTDLLAR